MDMFALSRDEVCRRLALTPAALDALIAGGHILCQLSNGETRIPIDQLEAFFRDGLLRVYRAQALEEEVLPPAERPAIALPAEMPSSKPGAPGPPTSPTAAELRSHPGSEHKDDDVADLRVAPRFIPRRQVNGIIDDVRFTIVQLSSTGLRIRHADEILSSPDSKLTFALLNPARSFVMRGRVVWTSAATTESGERKFFISGVRITEHVDRLANAIEILSASHDFQPDRRTVARPVAEDDMLPGASDDDIALVMKAVQHFAADPLEANRWYARGRFALAEPEVRRAAPRANLANARKFSASGSFWIGRSRCRRSRTSCRGFAGIAVRRRPRRSDEFRSARSSRR